MATRSWRLVVVVLVSTVLLFSVPSAAQADMEETTRADLLVLQSISLIANGGGVPAVSERINDALKAPDQQGTDLASVRNALAIVDAIPAGTPGTADLARARTLLAGAIDIRAASGYGKVPQPGEVGQDVSPYASGADTGTITVLDELQPARGVSDGGDAVLLTLAVLAVLGGLILARKWRPHTTIADLRRRSAEVKES